MNKIKLLKRNKKSWGGLISITSIGGCYYTLGGLLLVNFRGCSRVLIRGQKAKNWYFKTTLSQKTGKSLILTKFPVLSHFFDYFDTKTLKNSILVDEEVRGSVSKIFRGVAIRLQGGCYSWTLKGGLRRVSVWDFWVSGGSCNPQRPPPNSTYDWIGWL